jgi:tetratricopeptide (TPR) repeat protein
MSRRCLWRPSLHGPFGRLGRSAVVALALAGLVPAYVSAQDPAMARAFELERRGNYAAAADAYRGVLATTPGDPAALLGLERVLLPLGRSAEIVPDVQSALAANRSSAPVFGVALRAWSAVDEPDSMRAVAERWATAAPGDETPYREWGAAALSRRDRAGARAAYQRGREQLHQPDALAPELAQLAAADGDFADALREWLPAIRRLPGYRVTAVSTLTQAPDSIRPALFRQLEREPDFPARRLGRTCVRAGAIQWALSRHSRARCPRTGSRRSRRCARCSTSSVRGRAATRDWLRGGRSS